MRARCVRAAFVAALCVSSGCSADTVTPPEPTLETPGAFVFATDSSDVSFLFRTLRIVKIDETDSLLEVILYRGEPASAEQAREWAKDRSWPIDRPHAIFSLTAVVSLEPDVVWFRTLEENELAGLR